MKRPQKKFNNGFGMIEVIVGLSVSSIMVLTFMASMLYIAKANSLSEGKLQASLYAREATEIAKDLERSDWSELSLVSCAYPIECHPEISGNSWMLAAGSESLGGGAYTRSISIEPVFRDQLTFPNKIVTTGGVIDPNTKKIITTVEWVHKDTTHTTTLETYVYNN